MSVNEGVTEIFKRGGQTLGRHKKTALGGIGGAGIATLAAILLPYLHDVRETKDTQAKVWEQISGLKERIAKLETRTDDLQAEVNQSKSK